MRDVEQFEPTFNGADILRPAPRLAHDLFVPFSEAPIHRPFVVAQIGQSLDGRIATISGESRDINGAAALDHLHRIRANVDAVVVGASTIVADDPQLTVRRVEGKSPARVVCHERAVASIGGAQLYER
jgi:diaminohydroxyphosphoribosylaminopyrimidine deaminase/5-amino-6-(5-phosphoribosylamino)uracil reductase